MQARPEGSLSAQDAAAIPCPKFGKEKVSAVSDNSFLTGSPKILISRLTLEFASGQIVLRMNARNSFPAHPQTFG